MLNRIDLQGRLTVEPELRRTQSGVSVCSFVVASERDIPDKATGKRDADFFNCVAWRGTADFISNYFHKGNMIVLSGRLQTRSYKDRDGNLRKATEVLAENVYFCGARKSEGNRESNAQNPYTSEPVNDGFEPLSDDDGELPF